MKRYDEYKQTGTPWIGEIPSHWEDSRLKYIGEYINGYAFKPEDWSSEGLPIIRIQDLTESNSNPNYFKGTINEKYLIKDGDILVSWAATLAAFKWNRGDAWLNQHIFKAIPNLNINYDFFFWILRIAMKNMKNGEEHGIMMEHVTSDLFGNFPIPVPPLGEQEAIAAYLDKKCGSIDAVISTHERRIALLEELKQSVITEAVTHGINPDAKLRPSGIDWIGNIPEHWKKCRIKYLINYHSDGIWGDEEKGNEDDINCYRIADFDYNKMSIKNVIPTVRNISKDQKAGKQIFNGDLLLEKSGGGENSPVGRVVFANISEPAVCSNFIHFLRIENSATSRFLCYYFNFLYSNKVNLLFFNQTTGIQNLNLNDYLGQSLYIPPLREQEEIVEYIDRKIKPIDASIAKAKREIELLKELKQSVITEAVTGKIKVC